MKPLDRLWFRVGLVAVLVFLFAAAVGEYLRPIPLFPYVKNTWQWIFDHNNTFDISPSRAVIMPHDMLSYGELNAFYRGLAEVVDPSVIAVVAPDHREGSGLDIQTTYADFQAIGGVLEPSGLVGRLARTGLVNVNKQSFINEHGITVHAGFIKNYFSKAEIVPIILKQDAEDGRVDRVAEWLGDNLPDDSLVIASLDFSHYLNESEAGRNDAAILKTIRDFDFASLPMPDGSCAFVDSPSALRLIMKYAEVGDWRNTKVILHDNTADLLERTDLESTTGHFYIEFV